MRLLSIPQLDRVPVHAEHQPGSEMAGFGHFLRFCREQLGPGLVLYLHCKGEGVDVWVGLAVSAVWPGC